MFTFVYIICLTLKSLINNKEECEVYGKRSLKRERNEKNIEDYILDR